MGMKADTWLGIAGNVTSVLVGAMLGVSIAGAQSVGAWLETWQTLVAGFLAVVAGGLTVAGTMWADQRQDRRHDEIQRLTVRADKASAARAAYLAGDFFDMTYLAEVDELPADAGREWVMASNANLVNRARDWTKDIEGKLKSVLITEARPLFDPLTAVHYEQIEGMLKEIEDPLRMLQNAIPFQEVEQQLQLRSHLVPLMEDIREHLKMFADDLAGLGETYL